MVDDTFLQDMERAEQEAIETVASQEFRASQSQSQAQTRVGTAKKPASRAMDLDFLDEDDEDDEDDGWQIKTKGTKSRPAPDVIEISD